MFNIGILSSGARFGGLIHGQAGTILNETFPLRAWVAIRQLGSPLVQRLCNDALLRSCYEGRPLSPRHSAQLTRANSAHLGHCHQPDATPTHCLAQPAPKQMTRHKREINEIEMMNDYLAWES